MAGLSLTEDMKAVYDRAQGCVVGALVADATGGVLEFMGRLPSSSDIDRALTMPGGGVWSLGPGQITDDGELALCLAQGLVAGGQELATRGRFPEEHVAKMYRAWIASPPFDIGAATQAALGVSADYDEGAPIAQAIYNAAASHNTGSKSNGSLMRCTPLCVWGVHLPPEALAAAAKCDTAFTHPSPVVQAATAAYVICGAVLIRTGDVAAALDAVDRWVKGPGEAPAEVLEWLEESKRPLHEGETFEEMMGFIRWGFVQAFRSLRLGHTYEQAIREVLARGGDTDTNACIVCGLVGARWGLQGIPNRMKQAVLVRDVASPGRKRPPFLQPSIAPKIVEKLFGRAILHL